MQVNSCHVGFLGKIASGYRALSYFRDGTDPCFPNFADARGHYLVPIKIFFPEMPYEHLRHDDTVVANKKLTFSYRATVVLRCNCARLCIIFLTFSYRLLIVFPPFCYHFI